MKSKITELNCPNCDEPGTIEIQGRICICDNTECKQDILSGSFFEWECPGCKEKFFIKSPFLYNDNDNKFMVYYIPDYKKPSHKVPTLLKTNKEYDTENSTLRIAVNYVDFVEKIRILEAKLDDRAVEAEKLLYSKMVSEDSGENIYSMVFEQADKDSLHFAVFLKDKDFEVVIPRSVYEQTRADFSKLFADTNTHDFIVIDQNWISKRLSE